MSRHDTTASPVSHRPFLFTPFLPSSTQCRRPVTQLRLLFEWTIKRPRGERLSSPDHSISVRSTWSQVVHQPSLLPLSRATRDKENALQADVGDVKGERRKEEEGRAERERVEGGYCCHQLTKYSVYSWRILSLSPCRWQGAHYARKEANNNGRPDRLSATCFDGARRGGQRRFSRVESGFLRACTRTRLVKPGY